MKLVRGAGIAFVAQSVGLVLNYALNVVLARFLGAQEYGTYVFALSWLSLLAIPSTLGFTTSIVKLVPEYVSSGKYDLLKGAVRYATVVAFLGGVVFAAVAIFVYLGIVNLGEGRPDVVILVALGAIPLLGLANLESGKLRGFKNIGRSLVPIRVMRPAGLLILIVAYGLVVADNIRAIDAMVLHVAVLLGIVVVYHFTSRRAIPENASAVDAAYLPRAWVRLSLPLLLVAAFSLLLNNTALIMVGLLSQAEQVGFYNAAARTANVIGFALLAANSIAAPLFAEMHARGNLRDFQVMVNKTCLLIVVLTLPLAILVFLFSALILSLFGPAFEEAKATLYVLAAGQVVNAAAGSVGVILDMTGYGRDTARVFGASVVLNLVLDIILVPKYGAMGAAIATATTMVVWNITLVYLVRKRLSLGVGVFSLVGQALGGRSLWK